MSKTFKKIGEARIDYTDLLGSGANSRVYKCWLGSDSSRYYAAKELHLPKELQKKEKFQDFIAEKSQLLAQHQHPNVVSFEKLYISDNNLYLISELCDTSLDKLKNKLTRPEILKHIHDIAGALYFLSALKHIHRDVKPSNILIKENNAKLADFDIIREMNDPSVAQTLTAQQGTMQYMAPEVYDGKKYNYKCDVWSLGISLFEMLYEGRFPWKGCSNGELFKNTKEIRLEFEENDRVLKDLIENMLRIDSDDRLDWDEVYYHEAFADFIDK